MPTAQPPRRGVFAVFAALAGLQAALAIIGYLRIPTDPANAFLLGYSSDRWLLMAVPALLVLISGAAAAGAVAGAGWFVRLGVWLESRFADPAPRGRWTFAWLAAGAFAFVLLTFTTWEAVLDRLRPLLVLGVGLSLEAVVFLPVLLDGWTRTVDTSRAWLNRGARKLALVLFLAAAVLFFGSAHLVGVIGLDVIGWNTSGAPILDIQFFALLLVLAAGVWIANRRRFRLPGRADWGIFALIWVLTAAVWANLPLKPSWYLSGPKAPHFAYYPNSDALVYDLTAQNMLVGEGLRTRAFDDAQVRRPPLTFFFGLLHTAAGQDFEAIGALQAAVLAVFPALVYLAGKDLGGRFSGLVAALLVAVRESNAIGLSDLVTVAHAKLLMSDIPTAIGVAGFLLVALPWVRKPGSVTTGRMLAAGAILAPWS